MMRTLVRLQTWWRATRPVLAGRLRDERGDIYTTVIIAAFMVTAAIAVGFMLMNVFIDKAGEIDPNAPPAP